jgi:hypothetical protein
VERRKKRRRVRIGFTELLFDLTPYFCYESWECALI